MLRTPHQNIELHVLLMKLGIDLDQKEELVSQYTNHRTVRSSKMNKDECQKLINALRAQADPNFELLDRKRKRVISHLIEAGFVTATNRADMKSIHAWVKRQKHKKHLNDLDSRQLSELIVAAKGVRDHFLKKVDHARTT